MHFKNKYISKLMKFLRVRQVLLRLGKLLLTRKDWIEIEMLTKFKRASLLRNKKFCKTGLVASFFHFFCFP
jgi:hypothetical protein